ncbi:RNA polymerase sigma factor [Actinomadura fulvescens]|uniref:Sigma-70 family RNA polymerase sigma factor n=1 Tax=Actinomadura fulvescens TaxID=46160 RepID=A0ABP6BRE5_9ACTN
MDDPKSRFTRLYDAHYRSVLRYALIRAAPDVAEDVVSETFLVAWRRLDDVPDQELPWLLGVARNLLRKQHATAGRRDALADRIAALTPHEDGWDLAERVVERDSLLRALAALPEKDVEALTLVAWHGLEPRQAARVAGCPAATFHVRLHRARKRLAARYRAQAAHPQGHAHLARTVPQEQQ